MKLTCRSLALPCLLLAVMPGSPARGASEEAINNAIDKGIKYLLAEIEGEQVEGNHTNGRIALETYALVVAGVAVDHPLIERNFKTLERDRLNHTYTTSCYAFALDAAISQIHADMQFLRGRFIPDGPSIGRQYRARLEDCIRALVKAKHKDIGRWNYGPDPAGKQFDNSNTQFAVLALGLAKKRNIPIEPRVWEHIAEHFIQGQQPSGPEVKERIELVPADERGEDRKDRIRLVDKDGRGERASGSADVEDRGNPSRGKTVVVKKAIPEIGEEGLEVFARGWSYRDGSGHGGYKWNMTCAGLSSMLLALDNLQGKVPASYQNKINKAIRDGFGWMMKHWNIQGGGGGWKYYGIYSLEKVGDLGHVKKFGEHDWYQEVADYVVGDQLVDGGWPGENDEKRRETTAFALLVLNRATSLLTQRSDRMVITGPGAHKADQSNRDFWVYVPELDRELHFPSVFRMVQLRPNIKALRFVELIVDSYPRDRKGFLVPHLVKIIQEAKDPRLARIIREKLDGIVGTSYDDLATYMVWARRWKDVQEIGEKVKREDVDYLLKYYENTEKSTPLRERVIWALSRIRAKEAASRFVEDLRHDDVRIRAAAYAGLTVLPMGKLVPRFNAEAPLDERQEQLEAVEAWLQSVSS